MGTTLTAAHVGEHDVTIVHVGDSRCYRLRDGELERLTVDHTLVEELVRQGRLAPEEAGDHPQRSIVTRVLGPEALVRVDTHTFPARDGDVFLLCSDGLTTMLGEQTGRGAARRGTRPARAPRAARGARQRRRRPRQHHRRPVPPRGRSAARRPTRHTQAIPTARAGRRRAPRRRGRLRPHSADARRSAGRAARAAACAQARSRTPVAARATRPARRRTGAAGAGAASRAA